jgi:hypothetical protein
MEILDLAKEQLNSADQRQTLEKYHDFFEEIREFGPKDQNYLQAVRKRIERLDENMTQKGRDRIEEISKEKVNLMQGEIDTEKVPGLIIFIGNGIPDGHAILLDGNPWIVIDLKTFVDRSDTYDGEVYLTHEISHAFHYEKAPSFYFGNDQRILEPPIFKTMIVEGVATYLSFLLTSSTAYDAYWFGQYPKEEVEEWIHLCEEAKSTIGDKVDTSEGEVTTDLMEQLFDVPNRDLGKSRLGYYHGTKIVQKVVEEGELKTALNMKLKEYKNYIFRYFDL